MATPLVAGCVAVTREYLIKKQGLPNPSAALVKALLINGARSMRGQYVPPEVGAVPNNSEGFGRVFMPDTVGPLDPAVTLTLKDENTALDTNQEETTTVSIPAGSGHRLKVTLVWMDPAGEALQNDLDLIVRASSGDERHGNVAAGSTDYDRANNVEQVEWPNIPSGTVTITVRAQRITQGSQTYALVIRVQ